ncbi:MAG: PatA/PatG family cyanobactin maturation protease [Nitrosomonas ureae]
MDLQTLSGLKALWAETLGDPRVCVAVLDGPINPLHPGLVDANLTQIKTLASETKREGPALQHGTHITSIIFGQHTGPIKGIAPHCRALIVPIFSDGNDGRSLTACSQLDLARAISQAIQQGAQIINISGGEFTPSGTAHPLLAKVVQASFKQGILIVAATGNDGCECLHIPGALPSVLAVGAMNFQGLPLDFSNWSPGYRTHGILAPGENILGANPSGGLSAHTGTSYATPIVSGVAALLLSLQLKYRKKPDLQAIRSALINSAIGCDAEPVYDCRRLLAGRLNIKGATSLILKGINTMSNPNEATRKQIPENCQEQPQANSAAEIDTVFAAPDQNNRASYQNMVNPSTIQPSSCGCDSSRCGCSCGKASQNQVVFALGKLNYDFGTEARRDSIKQHMASNANDPYHPEQLLAYLEENPWDAAAIYWTLNLDTTPIYAIQATGAFADRVYQRLREFLEEQTKGEVERISIPGSLAGSVKLFTGQVVAIICPSLRGMYSWNTKELAAAVCKEKDTEDQSKDHIENFLIRVYEELRNLGVSPQDRAVNYAATNALLAADIFEDALRKGMELDTISVERSPICRPESDCWDVKLSFFNPCKIFEQAKRVYLFTTDVSDIVPVMVGKVRTWSLR